MKYLSLIILFFSLISCNQKSGKEQLLEKRIEQLEVQLSETYKPGFGEMMSSIQAHHAKLWFAGKNNNWELAAFEVKELNEILGDIKTYQKDRKETAKIDMINSAITVLDKSIKQTSFDNFNKAFIQLTNDCNKCHEQTNFGYNKVKIPKSSPFTNQEFKLN